MKEDQIDSSLIHMDLLELPLWNYKGVGGLAISHHHHMPRILKEENMRGRIGIFFKEFKSLGEIKNGELIYLIKVKIMGLLLMVYLVAV